MNLPELPKESFRMPLGKHTFDISGGSVRFYTSTDLEHYGEACYRKAIEDAVQELDVRARIAGTRGTKTSGLIRTVLTEVIVTLRELLK